MITLNEFENFLYTDLVYEQKIVSVIDDDSKQILIENIRQLHDYTNCTIKLEQMEKYNRSIFQECRFLSTKYFHFGPVTCHAFLAFKDSKSFGLHTDPDDVIIHCISGSKTLYVKDQKRILKSGDHVYIPANTPHEIINEDKSLILSFGLEKFYVDKVNYGLNVLSEND
jgi:mannose-6-phosphate isomerase-like protein (cupin superfamily)